MYGGRICDLECFVRQEHGSLSSVVYFVVRSHGFHGVMRKARSVVF
jgi:hypothetical protein